jgi:hypothetical protein
MDELIQKLEATWDKGGLFDHLRAGLFNQSEAADFTLLLRSIRIDGEEMVPTRFLSLIWYIPSFLDWQRTRVAEKGGDVEGYAHFITEVINILEEVIGVP